MLNDEDLHRIAELIAQSEERTLARIERVETSLLTEFHKWASPLRVRSHATAIRAMDLELEAVTERLTNLKGRQS